MTCSNMLYTCKPDKQKLCQISIHFLQGSKQYGDTVHHNHFPVPFCLSAWICFEILFVFSCFWEFLEQQAFLFSDTSLGLNILQTYLSMIEVLFFTGSYTKIIFPSLMPPQWWTKKQALFHINLNIRYHLKVPQFGKTDSTVAFLCCRQMTFSMWEFNLKSVLLMPG